MWCPEEDRGEKAELSDEHGMTKAFSLRVPATTLTSRKMYKHRGCQLLSRRRLQMRKKSIHYPKRPKANHVASVLWLMNEVETIVARKNQQQWRYYFMLRKRK
jgi:hypothetical protein